MKTKIMIVIAVALVIVIVVSAFAYIQQKPQKQSSELFTLRPEFFTLPYTYFNIPSPYLLGNYFLGNYTNVVFANNYSGLQFNASSSSAHAFNIFGEQKNESSGPFIVSGYAYNSSGWYAQAGFYINCVPQILNTVSVSGLAGATNDQVIISNNQLTVQQSGITLINAYSLPSKFYVDVALSTGSPNSWISGNAYASITGMVPFNSATAITSRSLEATTGTAPYVNLDGDLKMKLPSAQRNLIWEGTQLTMEGTQLNETGNWFSGDEGASTIVLGYNFSAPQSPFGTCDINFVNASGNRPFPFMSYSNYAIPKIYYDNASNLVVHFDIKMLNFTSEAYMRTAVVVELMDSLGHPYYFELDIKDGSKEILPYLNSAGGGWEQAYADVAIAKWVHFDSPFNAFINTYASQIAKNCYIGAFYLVNECFGSGYVSYDVANWWLTI